MGLEPRGQVIKFSRRLTVQGQRVKELPKGLRLLPACSYRCFFPKAFSLQHFEIKLLPKKRKTRWSQQWHHWSQGNTLLLTKVVSSPTKTLRTCLKISLLFIDWTNINNFWSSTRTFISHCLQKFNYKGKKKKKKRFTHDAEIMLYRIFKVSRCIRSTLLFMIFLTTSFLRPVLLSKQAFQCATVSVHYFMQVKLQSKAIWQLPFHQQQVLQGPRVTT